MLREGFADDRLGIDASTYECGEPERVSFSHCKLANATWLDDVASARTAIPQPNAFESSGGAGRCATLSFMSTWECARSLVVGGGVGALAGPVLVPLFFLLLCVAGFGPAGVTAGSCAAACMTPLTAAGSCFALSQSAAALGCWATAWPVALALSLLGAVLGLWTGWTCGDCPALPTVDWIPIS